PLHSALLSPITPRRPCPRLFPYTTLFRSEGHAWFDFAALCEGPRAASDYIEIATECHTVLVGGIPRFDGENDDPARRFVHLVDEDRKSTRLNSSHVKISYAVFCLKTTRER